MAATQIVKETHKNNSMQFVFDNEIGFQGEQLIAAANNHAVEAAIKQLRDAFSSELNNYSQKNRNAIRQAITSASALRNDLNQEDQCRQALGGEQWIRSASCLFNLADLGGYVVCDASLTEFETKIRVAFTGTDISEQFDLIFQRLFFIPNIGGKDRYDAVLHFRCRSGSNDANQRALIKAFFTSEDFKQEFGKQRCVAATHFFLIILFYLCCEMKRMASNDNFEQQWRNVA